MQDKNKLWLTLFLILSILNISAEFLESKLLIYITKPLLLTVLAIYFHLSTKDKSSLFSKLILVGLIFSIGGDTILMFNENTDTGQQFFLFGLVSFLVTHICYLLAFFKYPFDEKSLLRRKPWLLGPFNFTLVASMTFLWPDIPKDMRIPVAIYSFTIILMAALCFNLSGKIAFGIFKFMFAGALLFVLSDGIIALNKFKSSQLTLPYPRLLIMIPYLIGQYLIVKGSILANEQINIKCQNSGNISPIFSK